MDKIGNPSGGRVDDSMTPIRSNPPSLDRREHRLTLNHLLLFLIVAAGIITAGYIFYSNTARNFLVGVERELSSVAELKAGELVQWRQERLADVSVFYRNRVFTGLAEVRRVLDSPWFLIARIDIAEVHAPLRERLWLVVGLVAALLFSAGMGAGLIWRQRRVRLFRERLAAAKTICDVSSRHEALVSAVPDIIMEVDQNKVCTWANPAGIEFFGEDVIGKEAAFYFEGEQETYQKVQPLFNGHGDVIYVESWQRRKDGEKRLLAWWCRVLKDKGGRVIGAMSSGRDITESRQAEEALRDEEKRLLRAQSLARMGFLDWNLKTNEMFLSDEAYRIHGLERREGLTTPELVATAVHRDDVEFVKKALEQAILQGKEYDIDHRVVWPDGTIRWVHAQAQLAYDPKGAPDKLLGTVIDITERKLAEERLQAEQNLYMDLVNALPVGAYRLRVKPAATWDEDRWRPQVDSHYAVDFVSDAYCEILGISRQEFEANPGIVPDRVHSDDKPGFIKKNTEAILSLSLFNWEGRMIVPEKGTIWVRFESVPRVLENGDVIWTGLVMDLTERKRAEERLRESEAKYRAIIETNQEWIWQMDNHGIHTYSNPAIERILGYSVEDIVGKDATVYMNPEDRRKIGEMLPTWIKNRTGWSNLIVRWLHKDGSMRRLESNAVPLLDAHGQLIGFQGSDRDITERMRAEEALRSSLQEKEVLIREVHHRVKNNMQVISSLFNLQSGYSMSEECRGVLKEAQTRIRSMSLVHEKLYKSSDLSKIDLAGYIQTLATHLFQVYLISPEKVRLETEFEDVSVDINSAVPCGLILNELISNALKHAFPAGRKGVIMIGLRRRPEGRIELRVADDGVGLPKGLNLRKAKSFGLQIVNLLVDQLDGAIDVDRTNGTAVTLTFHELKYAPRPS